ncbi:hypothetical protein ISCGN_025628 [Ixodes scapularis]
MLPPCHSSELTRWFLPSKSRFAFIRNTDFTLECTKFMVVRVLNDAGTSFRPAFCLTSAPPMVHWSCEYSVSLKPCSTYSHSYRGESYPDLFKRRERRNRGILALVSSSFFPSA